MEKELCLMCAEDAKKECYMDHQDWITNYPTDEDLTEVQVL